MRPQGPPADAKDENATCPNSTAAAPKCEVKCTATWMEAFKVLKAVDPIKAMQQWKCRTTKEQLSKCQAKVEKEGQKCKVAGPDMKMLAAMAAQAPAHPHP